jgi:hypothetical protein
VRQQAIDKVDILFMIDGSASMGDKQALLAQAVPDLVNQLLVPANGDFAPVHDMHIGVISSSLGASDACATKAHPDDRAHLLSRTATGGEVANAKLGFLSYLPDTVENFGKPRPANVITDPGQLQKDFADLVVGVQETGCGLEAQLESWYRFLVQPDPWQSISVGADGVGSLNGIDEDLLRQRHAFLRPDSLLAIIVVTDEEDSWSDPMWHRGQGWKTRNIDDGWNKEGLLPRGTSACNQNPLSPACVQCGSDPSTTSDPNCLLGAFSRTEDSLNVRYTDDMPRRYGIAPQFPVERYIDGLRNQLVPDRASEHATDTGEYVGRPTCTNPIYAAALPADAKGDLCHLPYGPRHTDDVFFGVIGGVPNDLVKPSIDWTTVLGRDPKHFDASGIDTRMVESIKSRGLPGDWDTTTSDVGLDLQYACTFELQQPKDCSVSQASCDCERKTDGSYSSSPVCAANPKDANHPTLQARAKAYPTIRELRVAQGMKDNGVVASICPKSLDPMSPDFGYRPAVQSIIDKLKTKLGAQCLPQKLDQNADGRVACSVLTIMPGTDQASACPPRGQPDVRGLQQPDADVLAAYNKGRLPDDIHPVCELTQQLGMPSCEKNGVPGWCYVEGLAGQCVGGSDQAIKFGVRPVGPTVIQCIQQSR